MRRLLTIVLGDNWAEFRGPGSRQLYVDLVGRPPCYNTRTKSWVTVPHRVKDLAALAESRFYDVTVQGADPGAGRW